MVETSTGILSLLRPTAEQTDMLRACLWDGPEAVEAWHRWRRTGPPLARVLVDDSLRLKPLRALLCRALRRSSLEIEPDLRAALGAVALAEDLRTRAMDRICARLFDTLAAASVPFLVLKGVALMHLAYPDPALRHSHDVDLLIDPADRDRAADALWRAAFGEAPDRRSAALLRFVDPCGLPVELHRGLSRLPGNALPTAEAWSRREPCEIAGRAVATLSAADQLVQVLAQAAASYSRESLKWACDAWFLVARSPDLDWDVVLRLASASRTALPLATLLDYLAIELRVPVPPRVREGVAALARTADRSRRDIAFAGTRDGVRGTYRGMWRAARDWRERGDLVSWMLLPARASLGRGEPLQPPWGWPAYYLARPFRYAERRSRSLRRRAGLSSPPPPDSPPHRHLPAPAAADAAFLRAALRLRRDASLADAIRWGAPRHDWGALRTAIESERLGPLLHQILGARGVLPPALAEGCQLSYRATVVRNLLLLRELRGCLADLAAGGVPAIVLKGAALGEPVYRNPALRPMGDLDLLVHPGDVDRARRILEARGYAIGRTETHPGALTEHENELLMSRPGLFRLDVDLHWSLIDSPFYQTHSPTDWFWSTARERPVGGAPALTLGNEGLIVHLCAHLMLHHAGTGLLWWNDIAEVLDRERDAIDWSDLVRHTLELGLLLPVRDVLTRLAREWGAPIPAEALRDLAAARPSDDEARVVARMGQVGPAGRRFLADLASMPDWQQRVRFARTNLLPSAEYMRERYGVRSPVLLPFYYPYRWLRGAFGLR